MSTTSQITPPNRGTTAEPRSVATDAAVTKWVRRKRGTPRGRRSVAAIESRSRRRAARVRDHRQATRRLRHAFFRRRERGSGDPAPFSPNALRIGGLAKKGNFSRQNRKIAGIGGGGGVCQRTVCRLGSFNCHTLLPVWRRHELAAYTVEYKVDILAIQEHCIHFEDGDPVRRFELGKEWILLAASVSAAGVGGVGFIVSPRVRHAIDRDSMVSPRILRLQLSSGGQLKTVMFSVYSPTSSVRQTLSTTACLMPLWQLPRRHKLLVCSDFNANLARGDARSKHCPRQGLNRNQDLLRDLADGSDLVAVNTQFKKSQHRLVTYGPRGRQDL